MNIVGVLNCVQDCHNKLIPRFDKNTGLIVNLWIKARYLPEIIGEVAITPETPNIRMGFDQTIICLSKGDISVIQVTPSFSYHYDEAIGFADRIAIGFTSWDRVALAKCEGESSVDPIKRISTKQIKIFSVKRLFKLNFIE